MDTEPFAPKHLVHFALKHWSFHNPRCYGHNTNGASSRAIGKVIATIAPFDGLLVQFGHQMPQQKQCSQTVLFTFFNRVFTHCICCNMLNVPVTLIFKVFANNPKHPHGQLLLQKDQYQHSSMQMTMFNQHIFKELFSSKVTSSFTKSAFSPSCFACLLLHSCQPTWLRRLVALNSCSP